MSFSAALTVRRFPGFAAETVWVCADEANGSSDRDGQRAGHVEAFQSMLCRAR
jgi:hypothetical protein